MINEKIEKFIEKNIIVMTSERNTYSVKISSKERLEYDETIDGDTVEEVVYCKLCDREIECDFDMNEIVEHINNTHII